MPTTFGLTWEYRCPFARIVSDHVITALEGGADWDVNWMPFSLTQSHVAEGEMDAWDDPTKADTLYAMEAGIVVRDRFPQQFLAVHRALFDARHDQGLDLRTREVVHGVLEANGVDAAAVRAEIADGWPRAEFRRAHTEIVKTHDVFGVPTFVIGDDAVFVRLMDRPGGDAEVARRTIERVLDTVTGWPGLNEFKHTRIFALTGRHPGATRTPAVVARPQAHAGRPLTGAEALMWSLDTDPALRSSFMGITFMDRPPDPIRFRNKMTEAVASVAALRERVVSHAPLELGTPRWEIDPSFDLDYHVRHLALPPPGSRRQLLDLAALIYADPFDRARPLWQFTVVEGLEGGQAALLAKMHHVLSDGVGAIRLSVSFLDLTPEGDPPADVKPAPTSQPPSARRLRWLDAATGALGPVLSAPLEVSRTAVSVARDPIGSVSSGVSTVRSIGRQFGLTDPARSPLWAGRRSLAHRFDTLSLDLGPIRSATKALGGTINDGFVTVMAAAAGEYHRALGEQVEHLRMTMPISVRRKHDAAGNAWTPARLLVPTGPMDVPTRFGLVSSALQATKQDRSLSVGGTLAGVAQRVPAPLMTRFARQQTGTVDFACSNVRGAPFDLWISGAHVLANHPLGPTAGVAFNATVLSYRDALDLGLNTDTGAITHPDLLRDCIAEAAADLARVARGPHTLS